MSHAMGVVCPTCKAVTQPDICPEGCGSHGSSYIECGVCKRGDGLTADAAHERMVQIVAEELGISLGPTTEDDGNREFVEAVIAAVRIADQEVGA